MTSTADRRLRLAELLRSTDEGAPEGSALVRRRSATIDGTAAAGRAEHAGLRLASGEEIPAVLLHPAPERASGAGVVLIAGHGPGISDLAGLAAGTGTPGNDHARVARALVDAGITVLCPEMIGFGHRRVPSALAHLGGNPAASTCAVDVARHLMMGRTVLGHRVADARAAAHALAELPGIDPARIGAAGGSGGGAVVLLLAALAPEIRASLVAAYLSSFAASICALPHCPCNIVPGLGAEFEMVDIAALIAPRPLMIEAGRRDPIFPIAATRETHARLVELAREQGAVAPQLVETDHEHRFIGRDSVPLLAAALGAGADAPAG